MRPSKVQSSMDKRCTPLTLPSLAVEHNAVRARSPSRLGGQHISPRGPAACRGPIDFRPCLRPQERTQFRKGRAGFQQEEPCCHSIVEGALSVRDPLLGEETDEPTSCGNNSLIR